MRVLERIKRYLTGLLRDKRPKETRRPTLIEERSTCPLCIGSVDKIDDSENKAPTREKRLLGRKDI